MAIMLLEGFDDGLWYNRTGGTRTGTEVSSSYGLNGNGCRVGDTPNTTLEVTILPSSLFTLGFALKLVDAGTGNNYIVNLSAQSANIGVLRYDAANSRLFMRQYCDLGSGFGYPSWYSPTGSVSLDEWHYVELQQYKNTSSVGTFKWWLDGTLLDSETGIDYAYLNLTAAKFGGTDSNDMDDFYVDNIYVTDGTGSANTGELGPIEVVALLPDGNGNSSDLVGSDSNSTDNYLLVDNNSTAPPATTEYVGSATEGDKDTYTMDDLTGTPIVKGMVASLYAAKSDSGAKYMRPVVRTASTDYNGTSEGLAESYSLHEYVWDENPNTSAAWLYGAINGMEVGQEVRDS